MAVTVAVAGQFTIGVIVTVTFVACATVTSLIPEADVPESAMEIVSPVAQEPPRSVTVGGSVSAGGAEGEFNVNA